MSELRTSVVIDLSGNLQKQARQMGGSLERMGQRGSRAFRGVGNAIGGTFRGLRKFGTSTVGLLTGGGIVAGLFAAGRAAASIDERITRLGIAADTTGERAAALWERIKEVASLDDINLDPKRLLSAVEEIVDRTGDLEFAGDNLKIIGQAIQATDDEGAGIGALAAEFQKLNLAVNDTTEGFDSFFSAGRKGAFPLKDLARLGPRLTSAYTATGRAGIGAVRELAVLAQAAIKGTGEAETATTAVEALLRTLVDADKIEVLKANGIQVWDLENLEQGRKVLRNPLVLLPEIIARAGGDPEILGGFFPSEAKRAVDPLIAEFNELGRIESLDVLGEAVENSAGNVAEASARAAATANAQIEDAFSQLRGTLEETFTEPVKEFAQALEKAVQSEGFQALMKGDWGTLRAEIIGTVKALTIDQIDAGSMLLGALELPKLTLPTLAEGEEGTAGASWWDRLRAVAGFEAAMLGPRLDSMPQGSAAGPAPAARGNLEAGQLYPPGSDLPTEVIVRFEDAPPGLRVQEIKRGSADVEVDMRTGPAMRLIQ